MKSWPRLSDPVTPDPNIHLFRIGDIDNVRFERSRRARRINITVRPFKGIRVAVPNGVSLKTARAFATANLPWLHRQLVKAARLEEKHRVLSGIFDNIDRPAARKILVQRLEELARIHGDQYNRVFIRNQKTRWGSCSGKNNISLNIKLTRLPGHLMDYVILHELVHTRIKNHGPLFYTELDRRVPDRKARERAMKIYGAGLI